MEKALRMEGKRKWKRWPSSILNASLKHLDETVGEH